MRSLFKFPLFPLASIALAAVSGTAESDVIVYPIKGFPPTAMRVERVSYLFKNGQYQALIEAYVSPELVKPGSSLLVNDRVPVNVTQQRARFYWSLHPGPNVIALTQVNARGSTQRGTLELAPPPNWTVALDCGPYRASWQNAGAPVATRLEAHCQSVAGSSSVRVTVQGADLHETTQTILLDRPTRVPLNIRFDNYAGAPVKATLLMKPVLPFAVRLQASLGIGQINSTEFATSSSQFEPHITLAIYSPFWRGRLESRLEIGAGTQEFSGRGTLRFPFWTAADQHWLSPFADLGASFLEQFAPPNPLAPSPLVLPLFGAGMQAWLKDRWSIAWVAHVSPNIPSPAGNLAAGGLNWAWDVGAWLAWTPTSDRGTLWFARARYFSATLSQGASFTGNWSSLHLELGWGGKVGPSEKGGFGVGL